MKKTISLLLALVLAFSLSAAAFAEHPPLTPEELEETEFAQTGETTITATVPDNEITFIMHIPANMNLSYGVSDRQVIGDFYVTDVTGYRGNAFMVIKCHVAGSDLKNGEATIPVTYSYIPMVGGLDEDNPNDWFSFTGIAPYADLYEMYTEGFTYEAPYRLAATVTAEDWAAAAPGTYTAKVNFYFEVAEIPHY